jgi:hypothetical protein
MEELRKKVKEFQGELSRKREAARTRRAREEEEARLAREAAEAGRKAERRQKVYEGMQKIKKRMEDRESVTKKQE